MRNPTPVITRVSAPESRSKVNPMSTRSDPTENQLNAVWWNASVSSRPENARRPTRKERRTASSATAYSHPFGSHLPTMPQTAAPISGSKGRRWSQETSIGILELERVELVDVDRRPGPEHGDDDGQAHRCFRRRGGDHEEDGGVPGQKRAHRRARHEGEAGERQESEVRRVEHQLDAHQHHDGVAPQHHAGRSEGEQERGEHQIMLRLVGVEEVHQIFPFATTTAATTATSKS